ncbi:MAG: SMP-30/gluconolactonase/LRE family protein [Pseudomonadota bacterium]|nr:SMP-30/gluconolactonase/LRE family protein [Pseudomonadota bacterium]
MPIHDARNCQLGEGPLWHPQANQLYWFDILKNTLLTSGPDGPGEWVFDAPVSAAGWVSINQLFVASETQLFTFDLEAGASETVVPLDAENPVTRSNDGRADPQGGFWIGTMGKKFEPGVAAIYRYYRGELRKLVEGLTVANSICFAPDGRTAYYTDTPTRQIMAQPLDADGWPKGAARVHIDLSGERPLPDGSIVDSEGAIWNAQWNMGRVARYLPDGSFDRAVPVPARRVACPALGGPDLKTLFVTTARMGLDDPAPEDGRVYCEEVEVPGLPEYRVVL